jgi:hypothetical protein
LLEAKGAQQSGRRYGCELFAPGTEPCEPMVTTGATKLDFSVFSAVWAWVPLFAALVAVLAFPALADADEALLDVLPAWVLALDAEFDALVAEVCALVAALLAVVAAALAVVAALTAACESSVAIATSSPISEHAEVMPLIFAASAAVAALI